MAKYSNTVEYQIRTTLDSSGISQLKAELAGLQNALVSKNAQGIIPRETFNQTMKDIKQVENALTKAFNGKLGMLDLKKFNSELTRGGQTLNGYYQSFSRLGAQGTRAFGQMYGQMTQINTGMKQISSTTDKIMNTFGNTFRWGMIASVFSSMMNSIHQSVQYVKDLDNSLTQIMMVSGISRDNMNNFAVQANEAAKILGGTTVQMTEATKVFIQQGMNLKESTMMGEYAVHLANVSEQDSATTSDELTALKNAFKINLEDMGNAISKWAAIANNTAADMEELSIASQKAASVADTVGVDLDQFGAHIATIESVTREAPENIGNGLKTIYSRIADVKLGETLEDGVDLGAFSKALEKVGVDVLDSSGQLRNAGAILEDTMKVWQDLDQSQRAAVAKTVAGRFQLARFEALMNRSDIYENALNVSRAETGTDTYDRMQETYKDSMEGRLNTLTATIEGIFVKAFNTDDFYGLIDAAQALADTFDNLIQAIGGGDAALTALGAVLTKVFSNNIAQGIGNSVMNRQTSQMVSNNMDTLITNARFTAAQGGAGINSSYLDSMTQNVAGVQRYMGSASKEQLENIDATVQKHIGIMTEAAIAEQEFTATLEAAETVIRSSGVSIEATGTLTEKYTAIVKKLAEAEADGVAYEAAQDELYKALTQDVANLGRNFAALADKIELTFAAEQVSDKQIKQLQNDSKSLNIVVRELMASEGLSIEKKRELGQASELLSRIEKGEIANYKELSQALGQIGLKESQFSEILKKVGQDGVNLRRVLEELVLKHNQLSSAAAVSSKEMEGMSGALAAQNLAKNVATFASGAMNIIFAIQSIQGAFKAFNDESLDPFEQLEQGLMGLSMAAALTAPMVSNLIKAISQQNKVLAVSNLQKQANNMLNIEAKAILKSLTGMKLIDITLTKDSSKEERKAFITSKLFAGGKKEVSRNTVAAIAALTGQKAAVIEAEIAEAGGTVVTRSFATAFKELAASVAAAIAPMAPFIAIAAAIAGTIALVAIHVKKAHDEYYRFDIALEKAKDSLNAANEQLDIAKDNLEEVTESLDKIKNIEETFDGLTRGTTEWNQALLEANENVLDLINKYPDLSKYVIHGEYGELTLSKEGQEEAQDIAQTKLEGAQTRAAVAQNRVFEAERDKYRMDYIHENANFISGKHVQYIGGGYGSPGYQVSNDEDLMAETQRIVDAWNNVDGNVKKFTTQLEKLGYSEEQINALTSNTKELQELTSSLKENTLAQQASNEARAAQLLSDNSFYQKLDSNAQHIVDTRVATAFDENSKQYQEAQTKFNEEFGDNTDQMIHWAEQNGIFGEGSRYSNGKWWDADDQEIGRLNNLDEDELVDEIHEAYIGQAIADNIHEHEDEITGAILHAFTALDRAGTDNFADIFAGDGQFNDEAMANITEEDLKDIDFSKITDEDWQELGFDNAADFIDAFNRYFDEHPIKPNIEIPTDTSVDMSDAELSGLLEDTGMSENAFNLMSNDMYEDESGYYQQRLQQIEQEREALYKVMDAEYEQGKSLEEQSYKYNLASKAADELTEEEQGLEKQASDTAAMNLRTNKGIQKLVNSYEDLAYQLKTVDKNSADYYEVLGQLDEMISDVVNIDTGSLSSDFYETEEAMQAMQDLANGDATAIDRLRDLASQDIIQHMEITGVDAATQERLRNELMGLRDNLQNVINSGDPIKINSSVELSDYVAKLNSMVAMGRITAEQASQALSSIGMEAEIGTKKGFHIVTEDHYEMSNVQYGLPDRPEMPTSWDIKHTPRKKLVFEEYPYIKGAHYSGKGVNVANASALGGNSIGGGKAPSGGGGGGKGGGGKGKSYEPKKKDYSKKEKDRYEKVNTAIDELDSSIQNLTMDQDRLIGTRWADNLEKETKLLKEQVPWYKEKLKIQKAEAKELRDQLAKDFGAKFAANGQLQNYAKIFDNLEKARRDAYKKYNAATTEAGQKTAEDAIKKIEERQSSFEKLYQRYDTLWSKDIPATDKALKEIQDRLEDIAEEARKARREAAQNLDEIRETEKEIEKTFNNLSGEHPTINFDIDMARIEDLIGGEGLQNELAGWIADYENRLSKATDKEMKAYYKDQIALLKQAQAVGGTSVLDLNKQRLDQIATMQKEWAEKGYYTLDGQKSYNEKALQDMMKEALDDANDLFSNLDSAIQEAKQDIEDMAEMLDNEAEKRQNELDAIGDKIEHIQNLNELIYGDQATAQQINLYNMQAQNEENRLKELEKQRQEYHQMVELRRQIAEAEPENKTAQEEYLDALQKEQDLDKNILDTREKIAEAYKDAKEAANDLAVDNWLNNFNGMINGVNVPLEYMADQWERIQENEDLYLDDLNKAYEIQKLQNKYQQMLNDATDPAVQQQITDQMNEQLAYLREKTNLSKYDVDYANAQLEILQKTIALEDARAAKNTMKLRRDSQGNYQYVYAADQNKTGEAENDLLDATMNAYNMSKEQQADVQDNYIKKIQDMGDALRKAANDQTLTREQIAAITQSIIDDGYEYLNAMGEQLDTSQKNMIQSFIDAAFQMQTENATAVQDIAQDLQNGITDTLDMVDDRFDTSVKFWIGDDGLGKFQDEANETRDTIVSNVWDFEAAVSDANVAIARPLNEMEDEVNDVNTSIEDMTDTMGEFFNLLEQKSGSITNAADSVAQLQRQLTDSKNEASEYIQQLNKLNNENKKLQATNTQLQTTITDLKNGGNGSGSGGAGGGGTGKAVKDRKAGDRTGFTGIYHEDSWGNGTYGSYGAGRAGAVKISKFSKAPYGSSPLGSYGAYYVHIETPSGGPLGWIKPEQMFDTGGYTGAWGKGGRMAMLHEKELVLNADDTRNVLAAVDAVRQITEQLKGAAIGNGLVSSIGRAVQSTIQGSNVEQRVEITANFPNVNSAQEIENALLSLSDTSYQYAYNKNDIPW